MIGVLLVVIAAILAVEIKSLLVGEASADRSCRARSPTRPARCQSCHRPSRSRRPRWPRRGGCHTEWHSTACVAVMDQPVQPPAMGVACCFAGPQRHFEGVERKFGGHAGRAAPADDPSRVHVGDERGEHRPRPGRHVGQIHHPQLVGRREDHPATRGRQPRHRRHVARGGTTPASAGTTPPRGRRAGPACAARW
jgi:hypothetical protein